jgi:plasmid stabilization system protein ParE
MPNYVDQVRKLTKRYESQARKRIASLARSPAVGRGRAELLKAVRKLRTTLNKQLTLLEKKLATKK